MISCENSVYSEDVCGWPVCCSRVEASYGFDILLANNVLIVIQVHIKDTRLLSVQQVMLSVSVR